MAEIDSPEAGGLIREIVQSKPFLRKFYYENYRKYAACLERCPKKGSPLELGSGAGFAAGVIPGLITSDVLLYQSVDCVIDARELPFFRPQYSPYLHDECFPSHTRCRGLFIRSTEVSRPQRSAFHC